MFWDVLGCSDASESAGRFGRATKNRRKVKIAVADGKAGKLSEDTQAMDEAMTDMKKAGPPHFGGGCQKRNVRSSLATRSLPVMPKPAQLSGA